MLIDGPVVEIEQTQTRDEYHITCTVQGYPQPSVIWIYEGNTVEGNTEAMVTTRSGDRHTLIQHGRGNTGEYTCQATSSRGVVTKNIRIAGSNYVILFLGIHYSLKLTEIIGEYIKQVYRVFIFQIKIWT